MIFQVVRIINKANRGRRPWAPSPVPVSMISILGLLLPLPSGVTDRKTTYKSDDVFHLFHTFVAVTLQSSKCFRNNPLNPHIYSIRQALLLLFFYIQGTEAWKGCTTCPETSS